MCVPANGMWVQTVIEIEQKFRVDDLAGIRARVHELFDIEATCVLQQSDIYFSHPQRDFGKSDEALRMRVCRDEASGGEPRVCLTYKGPRLETSGTGAGFKMRKEIELILESGYDHAARASEMLTSLGFVPEAPIRKKRETIRVSLATGHAEVSLDEVEGLGQFVEVEMIADEKLPSAEAKTLIAEIVEELGLRSPIVCSYRNLLKGD